MNRADTVSQDGFYSRQPSQAWEVVSLPDCPQLSFWVWYKPRHAPLGLNFLVPEETFHGYPQIGTFTLRKLLHLAGVDSQYVAMWYLYGTPIDGMNGNSPLLDQPIPFPTAVSDPHILVILNRPTASDATPVPAALQVQEATSHGTTSERSLNEIFDRIESNWSTCTLIDKQLVSLRKQLAGMLMRLDSLNRDLDPDERLQADRQDKHDWQDARRWLRDTAGQVSRALKAYDIGEISNAGQRLVFQELFEQHVQPRQPFEGIEQTDRDFTTYRKLLQTSQINMNSALSNASQNGEGRARQILIRIASKVRSSRWKR